jgi:DNA-binding HxlR family transcriptional regulator
MENISLADVLGVISDKNGLMVFRTIAETTANSELLRAKLNITRKQFYSRISALLKTGLIKRTSGLYSLTMFGELVHETIMTLEKAFNSEYYWKLRALDSFDSAGNQNQTLSLDDRNRLIELLLRDDQKLRNILTNRATS